MSDRERNDDYGPATAPAQRTVEGRTGRTAPTPSTIRRAFRSLGDDETRIAAQVHPPLGAAADDLQTQPAPAPELFGDLVDQNAINQGQRDFATPGRGTIDDT